MPLFTPNIYNQVSFLKKKRLFYNHKLNNINNINLQDNINLSFLENNNKLNELTDYYNPIFYHNNSNTNELKFNNYTQNSIIKIDIETKLKQYFIKNYINDSIFNSYSKYLKELNFKYIFYKNIEYINYNIFINSIINNNFIINSNNNKNTIINSNNNSNIILTDSNNINNNNSIFNTYSHINDNNKSKDSDSAYLSNKTDIKKKNLFFVLHVKNKRPIKKYIKQTENNNDIKVLKNHKIVYVNKCLLNSYSTSKNIKKFNKITFISKNKRSSKYRGVTKNGNQWQVLIMFNKNKTYIGSYPSEELAGRIYDVLSIKIRGIKARTNYIYDSIQIKKISKINIDIKDKKKIYEIITQLFEKY